MQTYFERNGCLITANGLNDDKIRLDDYIVLAPLPISTSEDSVTETLEPKNIPDENQTLLMKM